MSAFARLGLPSTASESDIKRAYAKLLRQARPDDDPEGFQRLNEAYKEALAHCRSRTTKSVVLEPWQEPSETDKSPPTAETGPEASPQFGADTPYTDITTICDKIIAMAEQGDMQEMQQWLAVQPELWSLPLKNSIGDHLLDLLQEREPPICLACSQTLLEYFGFARVLSGYDPMFLNELQRRMHINWSIESNQEQELAEALGSDLKNHQLQRVLNQLRQPLRFWQWIPGLGASDASIMLVLRSARISASRPPPASLDQGQVAFWLVISDKGHLHRQHLALFATRFAFVMLIGLMATLFGWWVLTHQSNVNFVLACIAIVGLPYTLWCTFKALAAINRWHYCPEHLPIIWPWLCFGFIPLLCAGALLCMALNLPIAATFLSGASAWLASQRLRRGYGPQLAYVVYLVWWFTTIWICFQLLAVHPWYTVASFMGMALLMWILDVVNHRHFLRVFHGGTT